MGGRQLVRPGLSFAALNRHTDWSSSRFGACQLITELSTTAVGFVWASCRQPADMVVFAKSAKFYERRHFRPGAARATNCCPVTAGHKGNQEKWSESSGAPGGALGGAHKNEKASAKSHRLLELSTTGRVIVDYPMVVDNCLRENV